MFPDVGTSQLLTARDVERMSLPGKVTELIRGHLVVREPPGTRHGVIAATLTYYLSDFVRRHEVGIVVAQDTGFKIASDPDTVRARGGGRVGRRQRSTTNVQCPIPNDQFRNWVFDTGHWTFCLYGPLGPRVDIQRSLPPLPPGRFDVKISVPPSRDKAACEST